MSVCDDIQAFTKIIKQYKYLYMMKTVLKENYNHKIMVIILKKMNNKTIQHDDIFYDTECITTQEKQAFLIFQTIVDTTVFSLHRFYIIQKTIKRSL